MQCFLDSGPFAKLLTAVDHKALPPEVLSESLLSPVTALENARHTPKLRIMREHSSYLRPMQSRFIRNPDSYRDFVKSLSTETPDYYTGFLNVLCTQCVMYPPFLNFHLSRYGNNPPKTIAGSLRFTSDVRDSMQLIISQEVPFITFDWDLMKKLPPNVSCQVVPCSRDAKPELVVAAMRLVNAGMFTADRWQ
jgi:hypothetical protein